MDESFHMSGSKKDFSPKGATRLTRSGLTKELVLQKQQETDSSGISKRDNEGLAPLQIIRQCRDLFPRHGVDIFADQVRQLVSVLARRRDAQSTLQRIVSTKLRVNPMTREKILT